MATGPKQPMDFILLQYEIEPLITNWVPLIKYFQSYLSYNREHFHTKIWGTLSMGGHFNANTVAGLIAYLQIARENQDMTFPEIDTVIQKLEEYETRWNLSKVPPPKPDRFTLTKFGPGTSRSLVFVVVIMEVVKMIPDLTHLLKYFRLSVDYINNAENIISAFNAHGVANQNDVSKLLEYFNIARFDSTQSFEDIAYVIQVLTDYQTQWCK